MEEWKDIKGYEGIYKVSNYGRVKSLKRKDKLGRNVSQRITLGNINKHGYYNVALIKEKIRTCTVHRLVAEAFIPNPGNKPQVNHIDGNKLNNKVSNLEWVTPRENQIHAIKTGLRKPLKGESNPMFGKKFTKEHRDKVSELKKIKVKCKNTDEVFSSVKEASQKYGIDKSSISKCCKNKYKSAGRHPVTGEKMLWEYVSKGRG